MKLKVRTPATVANLGPGFDCLGLALDLWNEMSVETVGDHLELSIEGEGRDTLPVDATNAIYHAMFSFARQHGKGLPGGLRVHCQNKIPLGSGLGSSSAATIAGILAAVTLLDLPEDRNAQLQFATQTEGHPDNVSACLLGGLTISLENNGKVTARRLPVHPFTLLLVTPEYHFPTSQARAALPDLISHKDAVFNLSRTALLIDALRTGDYDLLSFATEDRLHQPYRIPLIPGAQAAMSAAREAGAISVVLAGAGPSLLVFVQDQVQVQPVGDSMLAAFRKAGLSARLFPLLISPEGASVKII